MKLTIYIRQTAEWPINNYIDNQPRNPPDFSPIAGKCVEAFQKALSEDDNPAKPGLSFKVLSDAWTFERISAINSAMVLQVQWHLGVEMEPTDQRGYALAALWVRGKMYHCSEAVREFDRTMFLASSTVKFDPY